MMKKYLTKTDKALKRVSKEYAMKQAEKHKERAWLKEHKQSVINTLPKRLAANFTSYDFKQNQYKNIDRTKKQSVYIHGEAHTGKTVLSSYLYLNFIHDLYLSRSSFANLKFHFVVFSDFIDEMQNNLKDPNQLVKKYRECDLLVLDDFGIKKVTDYVYSLTYLIINDRYLNMLPTIINSNHSLSELGSVFEDDRIIRRIEEDYILINKTSYKK